MVMVMTVVVEPTTTAVATPVCERTYRSVD